MSKDGVHASQKTYWIRVVFSSGIYSLHYLFSDNNNQITDWISIGIVCFSLLFFSVNIAIRTKSIYASHTGKQKVDGLDPGEILPSLIIVGLLYYFSIFFLIIYVLIEGLKQTNDEGGVFQSEKFINRLILFLIAIYILVQLWFSAAIINTVGSDENLLNNEVLKDVSLLFTSIGFGLLLARFAKAKGTNFFIPLVFGSCIMFYGQEYVLNYWASKQSTEIKTAALTGVLAKSVFINHAGVPNEGDEFKAPEKVRIELVYLPAIVALTNNEKDYRYIAKTSSYVRTIIQEAKFLTNNNNFEAASSKINEVWNSYVDYLNLAAMTKVHEMQALKMIYKNSRHDPSKFSFPGQKNYDFNKSCDGKANAVIAQIKDEAPRGYSLAAVLKNKRGRQKFLDAMYNHGVSFPQNWKFSSEAKLKVEIKNAICNLRDKKIKEFEQKTGKKFLNKGNPYTISEFIELITGVPNINSLEDFDHKAFSHSARKTVSNKSSSEIINFLITKTDEHGDEWFKAAVMPAIGLSASFVFMLLNILVLIAGLMREIKVPNVYRKGVVYLFLGALIWISKPYEQGILQAGLSLQESTYRHSNYWFSSAGLTPSLTDQTDEYRTKMSKHHLSRAETALKQSLLTTPPSRSALFHVTLAKYYDKDAKTKHLLDAMMKRYQQLGAENKESQFNERYNYIKQWNNVYL